MLIRRLAVTALLLLVLGTLTIIPAAAQSPAETLQQYLAELRQRPDDAALREKIIRHMQGMRPAPAVSEEARKHIVRGKAAFKYARERKDYLDAAHEFRQALLLAPWLAEAYYNLGVVLDKAEELSAAIESFRLYLVAAPDAPDAGKTQELIYEIEYRKDKAARESSPVAIAERKQLEHAALLKKIDGARYGVRLYGMVSGEEDYYLTLEVQGDTVIQKEMVTRAKDPSVRVNVWREVMTFKVKGLELHPTAFGRFGDYGGFGGRISDDGNTIALFSFDQYGREVNHQTYRRER